VGLNGETWRAHEFGAAGARASLLVGSDEMIVCRKYGRCGAATVGVQFAGRVQSFGSGYAPGDSLLVTCSDEEGVVGAAVLSDQ